MLAYIIRRILASIVIMVGVAAITFALLHYLAPSPVYSVLAKATPEAVKSWNRIHGFDRPEIVQFWSYLKNIFTGHFGYSYKLSQSVGSLFKENAGRSIYLTVSALVLSLIIAVPLGIAQAVKRNSPGDYVATAINFTLYSMPTFLLGIIFIELFGLSLHIFPVGVSDTITTTWGAIIHPKQLFLPIITLTLLNVAGFSQYMRSSALDVLAEDYIRLAKAKGLAERQVLTRHLLRNACLPIITLLGLSIPALLAGNLLIEYLFNYQGLGLLFINALGNSDYYILLAYTLVGALLTVIGNLVADVAIAFADPRVRLD